MLPVTTGPSGYPRRKHALRKLCMTLTATLAVVGAMAGVRAHAAVMHPSDLRAAADELAAVETVQFNWRGHRYCWYNRGWRGPGWYRCGFSGRRGMGWGGPRGWHGWRPPVHRPVPPIARPPGPNRPGVHRPPNRPGVQRPRPLPATALAVAPFRHPGARAQPTNPESMRLHAWLRDDRVCSAKLRRRVSGLDGEVRAPWQRRRPRPMGCGVAWPCGG